MSTETTETTETKKPALTLVGPVRLSYANIWKPRKNLKDELAYDVVLLFPKENNEFCPDAQRSIEAAKMGIKAAAEARFPKDARYGVPLLDGDKEGKNEGYWYMTAKSKYPLAIVGPDLLPVGENEEWASGDWAKVVVNFYGGEDPRTKAKNVGCGLRSVQFVAHDEHFGSGGAGTGVEMFEPVGAASAASTQNAADEYDPFDE